MKRDIIERLEQWKTSVRRKPLILHGARQVGKTWVLQEFGKSFPDGYVYINFEKEPQYGQLFEQSKSVERILPQLAIATGKRITENTLIVFDEIGESPAALNSLKYFYEDRPDLYVAAAGSLLGLKQSAGFPVGKVNILKMYPMSFKEFLLAIGEESLCDYITGLDHIEAIPDIIYSRLLQHLREYFFVGGMPEAVEAWSTRHDISEVEEILQEMLYAYERDMGKHPDKNDVPKIHYIWNSVPSQLARENKKFLYSAAKNGARAREYENALNWIVNADIVKKVYSISSPGLPLSAYEELSAFKIYMGDIGLLRIKASVGHEAFIDETSIFTEFKGAFTENYVLQSMLPTIDTSLHYWKDSKHEVDFIVQNGNDIIPIETKSGKNTRSASLKSYERKYNPGLMLRASLRNLSLDGIVLNIPLFMISEWKRFVNSII